jgi:hypothetical protein
MTPSLLSEEFVRFKDLIEREPVRQQRKQIQPPVPHQFHQPAHGFRPARAQRRHDFVIAQSRRERLQ